MADSGLIFLIGLFSSFGHCVGMCGGFVTAYTLKINAASPAVEPGFFARIRPHLLYNLGRVLTYMFLGALFGFIGETMHLVAEMRPYQGLLQAVAGIVMMIIGLDMGGWLPAALRRGFPEYGAFKTLTSGLFRRVRKNNPLGLGLAMGFIPCGLVYAAGAKAAAAGGVLPGMLTMLFFGLGTFPALLAVGMSAGAVSANVRSKVFAFATVLVIAFGLLTAYRGIHHFSIGAQPQSATAEPQCVHQGAE